MIMSKSPENMMISIMGWNSLVMAQRGHARGEHGGSLSAAFVCFPGLQVGEVRRTLVRV